MGVPLLRDAFHSLQIRAWIGEVESWKSLVEPSCGSGRPAGFPPSCEFPPSPVSSRHHEERHAVHGHPPALLGLQLRGCL